MYFRCKAIFQPLQHRNGFTRSQLICCIILIWLTAILFTLPWPIVFDVVSNSKDGLHYCVENWQNQQDGNVYYLLINLIAYYIVPLIMVLLSNACIWWRVSCRNVPSADVCLNNIKLIHNRTKHGVRRLLTIFSITFLFSWLPLHVLVTGMRFSETKTEGQETVFEILLPFAQLLGSWNSGVNPVLYAFLNKKFREMIKTFMPAWMGFTSGSIGVQGTCSTFNQTNFSIYPRAMLSGNRLGNGGVGPQLGNNCVNRKENDAFSVSSFSITNGLSPTYSDNTNMVTEGNEMILKAKFAFPVKAGIEFKAISLHL